MTSGTDGELVRRGRTGVERVRTMMSRLLALGGVTHIEAADTIGQLYAERNAAEAERDALREALKPFATLAQRLDNAYPDYADHVRVFFDLSHGDFRRARKAGPTT